MKIRNVIFSALEVAPEPPRWAYGFDRRSRALANYIYRNFNAKDLDNISPSRITIWLHEAPKQKAYESNGLLVSELAVPPNLAKLSAATEFEPDKFYPLLVDLLDDGLRGLETAFGVPRQRVLDVARDFVEDGYQNSWIIASRSPRGSGLKGTLVAWLTHDRFQLTFILYENKTEIHREVVYTSKPYEDCWYNFGFRQLNFDDGRFWIASQIGWSYRLP